MRCTPGLTEKEKDYGLPMPGKVAKLADKK